MAIKTLGRPEPAGVLVFGAALAARCSLSAVAVWSGGFRGDALSGAVVLYDDVAAPLAESEVSPLAL